MVRPVPAGIARNWPIRSVFFLVRNRGVICTGLLADTVYSGRAGRYDMELTPLVSKLLFVKFFIQCFKTIICFIWFNILRFFLSFPTSISLHFYSPFFTSTHLYTYVHNPSCHHISNTLRQKMMSFTFSLSTTPNNYIIPTLWYHLILIFMSILEPRKRACVFFFLFSDGGLRF